MVAVAKGHVEVVKLLLEKGAKVDVADNSGKTVIQYAEAGGNDEMVEILIKHVVSDVGVKGE